jgi:CRP-like cAMP-binding protein
VLDVGPVSGDNSGANWANLRFYLRDSLTFKRRSVASKTSGKKVTQMALSDISSASDRVPPIPVPLPPRTDRQGNAVRNLVLLAIPEEEFAAVRPYLEPVDLPRSDILYEQGKKIEHAHFLNEGMISLVVITSDGRSVEVGISGHEGIVGAPPAFGFETASMRAIVQLPGSGLRISSEALQENFARWPSLRHAIERHLMLQQMQVAQIAACNRLHDMDQRLARWLLMCQDRVNSEMLSLTHDFMAQMLGSGRPTVTIAAGILERAGLIQNTRGSVKILNRKRLEDAACECYRVIQNYNGNLILK